MSKFSRRDFARSVALSTLFSPFLSMLGERTLGPQKAAAAPGRAKYLLVFFSNACDQNLWAPRGSSLDSISFSRMTEPLAPLKQNLVLVDNLDSLGTAAGHAAPGGLTGRGYGQSSISVDQFASDALRAAGVTTAIPNLVLGGTRTGDHATFFRDGRAIDPTYSVLTAFETVFGGVQDGSGDGAGAAALLARRKSILDTLRGELRTLSRSLGSHEREKLGLYEDSIRQLEERIAGQTTGGGGASACRPGNAPSEVSEDVLNSATHLDIAINAFGCDLTRVASVAFGHHQSCQVGIPEVERPGDWHNDFTHADSGERARMTNLERYLCGEFVRAVDKLKSLPAPTGGGTLFDQTLIVWARDMGDAVSHNGNMRFVFSGGAASYLKTSPNGRFIDGRGQPHQRALMNCLEALGVSDFTGFGDAGVTGDGRVPMSEIGG